MAPPPVNSCRMLHRRANRGDAVPSHVSATSGSSTPTLSRPGEAPSRGSGFCGGSGTSSRGNPVFDGLRGKPPVPRGMVELLGAFDLGPSRTLQQDVEFGVLQIVDIALKAISPAVNDPTTAISCVDQLSRILIRFASRELPEACSTIRRGWFAPALAGSLRAVAGRRPSSRSACTRRRISLSACGCCEP